MRTRPFIAALALLAAGSLACTHTTVPAVAGSNDQSHLAQGRIQFEDSSLSALIKVEHVDPRRVGTDLMRLIVTFRNRTKDNLWFECRTTFLDSDGHVLEQTNWEPILLDGRTVTEYTCTSLGSRASEYQIIVRKPAKSSLELP